VILIQPGMKVASPVSALDMVRNLPGFVLDDGVTAARGFGRAAGNVLIDGERMTQCRCGPGHRRGGDGVRKPRIALSGGFSAERDFFFLEPGVTAVYARDDDTQIRAGLVRSVAQPDFFDFVSAADLVTPSSRLATRNLRRKPRCVSISRWSGASLRLAC